MKYRTIKDLAAESGFSRYSVDSAIKAGVIREEWIWRSPSSGRRKILTTCWQAAIDAMHNWQPRPNQKRTAPAPVPSAAGSELPSRVYPTAEGPIECIELEDLAAAAGVPMSRVYEAIESGEIPQDWLVETSP